MIKGFLLAERSDSRQLPTNTTIVSQDIPEKLWWWPHGRLITRYLAMLRQATILVYVQEEESNL